MKKTNILKHVLKALDFDIDSLSGVVLEDIVTPRYKGHFRETTHQVMELSFNNRKDKVRILFEFLVGYPTGLKILTGNIASTRKPSCITFDGGGVRASLLDELVDLMMDENLNPLLKVGYGK